ncbi:MAG TPA: T9SS type A sorting domain-containing protein, partial [Chitinophagaceae bacterium]|nr:T9SS type A sorting domain-containing protein [Chitinophagaceae bacterium]
AMGAGNATGYYENGETEDYRVLIDNFPLSVNLISFTAKAVSKDHVRLDWKTTEEANFKGYEIYRSSNNNTWNLIGEVTATGNNISGINAYSFNDVRPLKGKSFYRIKMISNDSKFRNSETRSVTIEDAIEDIVVYPNPATDGKAFISVNSNVAAPAKLSIIDAGGRMICFENVLLYGGMNTIPLPVDKAQSGAYTVRLQVNDNIFTKQLIISR